MYQGSTYLEESQQIELEVPEVRALFIGNDDGVEAEGGIFPQRKGPLAFFEPGYAERRTTPSSTVLSGSWRSTRPFLAYG